MPLLRVGQKVVVSSAADFRNSVVARMFAEEGYRGVIMDIDFGSLPYKVRVDGQHETDWFAEAEVTAVPDTAPAWDTVREMTVMNGNSRIGMALDDMAGISVDVFDRTLSQPMLLTLTPDEADQLSDMLHAAAAEARGTEGTP